MPLLPSASDVEPVLILTDEDFRKAFSRDPEPASPPPPASKVGATIVSTSAPAIRRGRSPVVAAAAAFMILAGGGTALWWSMRTPTPEAPHPGLAAVEKGPPKGEAQPESPPIAAARPKSSIRAIAIEEPPEEAQTPVPVVSPPAVPSRGSWNGGRAWVRVSLVMDNHGKLQELRQRAVIHWDGSEYVVKPTPPNRTELWMDRLQILLNMPWSGESAQRSISSTSKETLKGEAGVFDCDRVEGVDRFPEQRRAFTYWLSPEFPPGPLQAKVSFKDLSVELRVLGFGPEPGGE